MLIIKHTIETTTSASKVWALWEEVKNWNAWDHGIQFSQIEGSFKQVLEG